MKRSEMLAAMDERATVWDVIIIGGGATGLGAAVEAASRGHRTVLVEAEDFAKGTSSRSTKLIHGGVRYLRQGQIGMVRQSLRERERLLQNAPHLVHMLDFVLPTYRYGAREFYYAGLRFYDTLAGHLISGRARRLSKSEACKHLPNLQDSGLRGGVLYADGQFDDARLAITLARTAVSQGAVLANYLCVEQLVRQGSRVSGVVVRDVWSGAEMTLNGRVILNATGVFAEDILRMDRPEDSASVDEGQPIVAPSQGSHLVLDSVFLPGASALMIPETDDGRVLFAIPWHGKVLLGTTDLPVRQVSRNPAPLREEVEYLLDHAGRYLKKSPSVSDIRSQFSGLRPLVGRKLGVSSTAQLSREHVIHTSSRGLITVIGGKWTTYRQMGEDLINHAENVGGLPKKASRTATLRLHGCPEAAGMATSTSPRTVYGTDWRLIDELLTESPELAQPLHPRLAYRRADVVWAVRHEMAQTVDDVLSRRTRSLFLDAAASLEAAPVVADLMAEELERDEHWKSRQLQTFRQMAIDAGLLRM